MLLWLAHLDQCVTLVRDGVRIHFRLVMPLFGALYRLHRTVGDELGWDDAEIFRMLAGHSPATRAADDALAAIRHRVRTVPGCVEALTADALRPLDVIGAHRCGPGRGRRRLDR